jgi:hypothetical protein
MSYLRTRPFTFRTHIGSFASNRSTSIKASAKMSHAMRKGLLHLARRWLVLIVAMKKQEAGVKSMLKTRVRSDGEPAMGTYMYMYVYARPHSITLLDICIYMSIIKILSSCTYTYTLVHN